MPSFTITSHTHTPTFTLTHPALLHNHTSHPHTYLHTHTMPSFTITPHTHTPTFTLTPCPPSQSHLTPTHLPSHTHHALLHNHTHTPTFTLTHHAHLHTHTSHPHTYLHTPHLTGPSPTHLQVLSTLSLMFHLLSMSFSLSNREERCAELLGASSSSTPTSCVLGGSRSPAGKNRTEPHTHSIVIHISIPCNSIVSSPAHFRLPF